MAEEIKDEIVLNDDELICVLTGNKKKANTKELMLQSVILQMNEEYGFEMSDMKRDFTFSFQDDEDKRKRVTVDLAIFRAGSGADNGNRRDLVFRKISLYEKRRRAVFRWKETFRIVCVSFRDKADPRPFQPIKFLQPCRFLLSCLQKDHHALLCENSRFLYFLFLCRPDRLICSEPFP